MKTDLLQEESPRFGCSARSAAETAPRGHSGLLSSNIFLVVGLNGALEGLREGPEFGLGRERASARSRQNVEEYRRLSLEVRKELQDWQLDDRGRAERVEDD